MDNWKVAMQYWLEMFERESTHSLRKIKGFFGTSGRPFDENFRQYLLKMLTLRFDTSFNTVRFEWPDENPMQMTPNSIASIHCNEIASSSNVLNNNTNYLNASDNESSIVVRIEKDDDSPIAVADMNDEDVDGQHLQAANDTNDAQIGSDSSLDNFGDEHIDFDSSNENGIEVALKHEPKVENEIEMEDLPFAAFDPNNVNDSSGAMNDPASASELLENQSWPSSSMNEQNLPNSKRYIGKIYKCNSCAYTARNKSKFQRHQLIHESVKPFKCEHCDYAARQKSNLKKHQRVHDRQKLLGIVQNPDDGLYKCTHCDQKFIKWENLTVHLEKFHKNNQRLFNCGRCMRRFVRNIDKKRHESKCQRRRYECYLCKKYVTRNSIDMQEHLRIHSGALPLQCAICKRCFRHKRSLRSHLNVVHK